MQEIYLRVIEQAEEQADQDRIDLANKLGKAIGG